jgi:hypothetical protein
MAKILFGAGVADARNSLGGSTFTKNRFGAVLRQKVSPAQPRTPAQNKVRAAFSAFSKAWGSNLTAAQRAAWTALATAYPQPDKFGNPQVLTGLQMYQKVNRNLYTIGQPRQDTAPGTLAVTALTSAALTATSGGTPVLSLAFTPTPLPANHHLVVFMTPELSPGKTFVTSFLKLVFADTAAASASPHNLLAAWSAIFGALISGSQIVVQAFAINDLTGAAAQATGASAITT